MKKSGSAPTGRAFPLAPCPGKVISVTVGSGAMAPSMELAYLKPSSSIGGSGGDVECPHGVDALAYRAAIALIVGRNARQVSADDAWKYVSHVTAAADYGPRGRAGDASVSPLLARGHDGYTPIGPLLIDARSVLPQQIRLRSWRNGLPAKCASNSSDHLSLVHAVAYLSRHMTLETGDVILVGPAIDTMTAVPGDVIEIEVDSPEARGVISTGRLTSRIVSVPETSALCLDDERQRRRPGPAEGLGPCERNGLEGIPDLSLGAEVRAKLMLTPVAGISAQLRKRGLNNVTVEGVRSTLPGRKLVGVARTLRFVPNREDLFATHGGGYNAQKRAFDGVGQGEVIVIEARGESGSATLGDVLALRAHARGAAGIITDGGVRDYDAVAAVDIPIFSRGAHPAVLGRMHVPWEVDVTVSCGGTTIQPGDVIVGDNDGVIVIPPALVEEVVDAALAQEAEDGWIAAQVRDGNPLNGLFPMNAAWRSRFEADQARTR